MMRSSRWVVGLFLLIAAAAVAAPQESSIPAIAPKPAAVDPPLPPGPAPDLNLVFTGQVAGYVEPCG